MKIVDWISYDEAEEKEELGIGGLGGFFKDGMRWKDYISIWKDEAVPWVEELRSQIIKNKIKVTGREHQDGNNYVPLWENGKVCTYSYRSWGDLMAAVWSTEDDEDYSYMSFYC